MDSDARGANGYILVTPCRDEESNLKNLIPSVLAQSLRPVLWVIVDDGSTDKSPELISRAEKSHDFIKALFLEKEKQYKGSHYARVCNNGFSYAVEYCKKHGLEYSYVAVLDADNIPEADYFSRLACEFTKNPRLGLASGINAYADIEPLMKSLNIDNPLDPRLWQLWGSPSVEVQRGRRSDLPMGSARVWRRACFEETGSGFAEVPACDSVSVANAKLKGWETQLFEHIRVIEREGQAKHGLWDGYQELGENNFFRGFPFYFAVLKGLKYTVKKPFYIGAAYLWGYFKARFILREKMVDEELYNYYRKTRPKEVRNLYIQKLKRILGK